MYDVDYTATPKEYNTTEIKIRILQGVLLKLLGYMLQELALIWNCDETKALK